MYIKNIVVFCCWLIIGAWTVVDIVNGNKVNNNNVLVLACIAICLNEVKLRE